jgi:hypothetical protein
MLYVAQQPSAPERSPHDDARIARLMASRVTKRLLLCAAIASVAVSAYVTQAIWKENGLRALRGINEQRVQLIANAVRAEINRQDHLPVLVALDKEVQAALTGPRDAERLAQLRRKLEHLSREADTRGLYVIAPDGEVILPTTGRRKMGCSAATCPTGPISRARWRTGAAPISASIRRAGACATISPKRCAIPTSSASPWSASSSTSWRRPGSARASMCS